MKVRTRDGREYAGIGSPDVVAAMAMAAGVVSSAEYMSHTAAELAERTPPVGVRTGTARWFIDDLVASGLARVVSDGKATERGDEKPNEAVRIKALVKRYRARSPG